MQDISASRCLEEKLDHPISTFPYTISTQQCIPASLAYDGAALAHLAAQMLPEAGFSQEAIEQPPHDMQNYFLHC